ncbi:hypothetical protein GGI17_001501 [Coemansia sp. S146]|nr:hypothetical protein GGI17_001501 [Coemansia sp. S146]
MSAIDWRIRVKALMEGGAEKEFQVDVRSDETVGDFRGRLATTSQVEPQKQRLIYHGRLLVDDAQKLVDVGVSDGSALHMVARPTAAPAAPAPTAATSAERADSGIRGGRGDFLSNLGFTADLQAPQLQPTPFSLTPLAVQVMDQTFHRLRTRDRDAAGTPQSPQDARQRVIYGVHRDFGADNGGEWVASTANSLHYNIDREAALGSSLTAEEFRRGSIQGADPLSQGSNIEAYLPIPGLVSNDSQLSRLSEYLSSRAQPSRAQANELFYELRETLLPALRRLPGHENYNYNSTSLSRPHCLGRTTTNQIEGVGEALSGLGDAFIELGRSLQSVGAQWQSRNTIQPGSAYSPEQTHNILQALRQLVNTASVASPFLQTTLAQTSSERPTATSAAANRARGGDMPDAASTLLQRSPHQTAILMSNHRRARRLQTIDMAMDMPRPRTHATVEIEFITNHIPTTLPPPPNTRNSQQPQPQSQPQPQPRSTGPASIATLFADAIRQTGTTAHTAAGHAPGADSGRNVAQPDPFANLIEQLRSRVDRVFQDSLPGPTSAETSVQPPPDSSRSGQTGAHMGTSATASNASSSDTQSNNSEANVGFAGFVDRLSALGSQTARSDRSNLSTTTEYGSVIDATNRAPRFISVNLGGNGNGNGNMGHILPGLMQPNNPFSIASIFLGTEAGSTANTSRRASVASSTSAALTSDGGSNAGQVAGVPAPPLVFRSRDAATSAATGPRTGEVRARSDSISSSGNTAEGSSGSATSSNNRSSGSSKRHKPDEASGNEDQGSSCGR